MATEYETKVLDIDVDEIDKKLLRLGAKKEPEVLMKRWVFDINSSKNEWIRLRNDGKKSTITYKHRINTNIYGVEEIEVEVKDFNKTFKILSKLSFKGIYYQENKRIAYKLKDIEFTIDIWPKIPVYLEVESSSEEKVKQGLVLLGLENEDIGNVPVWDVYSRYGIDLHDFKELKF